MALTTEKRASAIAGASERLAVAKSMLAEWEAGSDADTCRLCTNGHRYPARAYMRRHLQAHIQSLGSFLSGLTGGQ
jgi:hypothetical protein